MGLERRPKSGRKFDGSKLVVDGMGIKTNVNEKEIQKIVPFIEGPDPIITPSITPTNTPTPSITATNTPTPSITATNTVTPSITPTNTVTPSITPTNTPTITPTKSVTPTITPTRTPSVTPTRTKTPVPPLPSKSVTPSRTPTNTVTPSNTPSKSVTPSNTPTITVTPSITPTTTITPSNTKTPTPTKTVTKTSTTTPTETPTVTPSKSPQRTPTNTPSNTKTPTVTPSITRTQTKTPTTTKTPTPSTSEPPAASSSRTPTPTSTQTPTQTKTPTPSRTSKGETLCNCWGIFYTTGGGPPTSTFIRWYECNGIERLSGITSNDGGEVIGYVCGTQPSPDDARVDVIDYGACGNGIACPSGPPISKSPTKTPTPTISVSKSQTKTPTVTPSNTATPTVTPSNTATPTVTPSNTPSKPDVSQSPSPSITATPSNTSTVTPSKPDVSQSPSPTITPTISQTPTNTPTLTNTVTPTMTKDCVAPSSPTFWISSGFTYNGNVPLKTNEGGSNYGTICSIWRLAVETNPGGATINQLQIVASLGFTNTQGSPRSIINTPGGACNCPIPWGIYIYNALDPSQPVNTSLTYLQIGLLLVGNNCEILVLTGCQAPAPDPSPSPTVTTSNTATPTVTPTETPTQTPTPTVTPSSPTVGPQNPDVSGCSVLYNTSNGSVYLYDPSSNTATLLNNITNLTPSTDIAHTETKMYMSETGAPNLREWDITLSPNFTSTFVTTHVLPFNLGSGLAVIDDDNVILTSSEIVPGDPDIYFYRYNTSTQTLTELFQIQTHEGQLCRVSGDMVLTTDSKLIVLVDNKSASASANRKQWIVQYSYPDGDIELRVNITPTILTSGAYAYSMYQYNQELYIAGGTSSSPWQATVDLSSPFAVNLLPVPPNQIQGASQIPGCIKNSFIVCTPPANTGLKVFLSQGYINPNAPSTSVNWRKNSTYSNVTICDLLPTIDGYLNNPNVCQSCQLENVSVFYAPSEFVIGGRLYTDTTTCDCDKLRLPDGLYVVNLSNPTSYQWSAGQTNIQFASVTVVNCIITNIYTCTFVQSLNAVCSSTNVTTFGGNNGSVTLSVTGGAPPYTVIWNGTTLSFPYQLINLTAGSYPFSVTDSVGATFPITCTVTEPPCVVPITNMTDNVQCTGLLFPTTGGQYNFGVGSASVALACSHYLGTCSFCGNGAFYNWVDFPASTVQDVRINIHNWRPDCPGGNCGTIYTPGQTSCGCNISGLPIQFWVNSTIPTNVNLNPTDGVYICRRNGCTIISATLCSQTAPTAPVGMRLLSEANTTMIVTLNQLNVLNTFKVNWNDTFDLNGQSTSVFPYSNTPAFNGAPFAVSRPYTQSNISAFFYDFNVSQTGLKVEYFKGFLSTPQTLATLMPNTTLMVIDRFYPTSIGLGNINLPSNFSELRLNNVANFNLNLNVSTLPSNLSGLTTLTGLQFRYGSIASYNFNHSANTALEYIFLRDMNPSTFTAFTATLPKRMVSILLTGNGNVQLNTGLIQKPIFIGLSSITSSTFSFNIGANSISGVCDYDICSGNTVFSISSNRFTNVTTNFSNKTGLTEFNVSDNLLTAFTNTITACTSLSNLYLYNNRLTDTSFTGWTIPNSVNNLWLHSNKLTKVPTIPTGCTSLSLGKVNTGANPLNNNSAVANADTQDGPLASTNSGFIAVNRNNFGSITGNWLTTRLNVVRADHCGVTSFNATLPPTIRQLFLRNFNLSDTLSANRISSFSFTGNNQFLTTLDISANANLNSLGSLSAATGLTYLNLWANAFTSFTQITPNRSFSANTGLTMLNLTSNNFSSETIAPNFSGLPNATKIYLVDCGLTSSIIDSIIIGLSNTTISGGTLYLVNKQTSVYQNAGRTSSSNLAFNQLTGASKNWNIRICQPPTINTNPFSTTTSIPVTWSYLSQGNVTINTQLISWKETTGTTFVSEISVPVGTLIYTITGLIPNRAYTVRIRTGYSMVVAQQNSEGNVLGYDGGSSTQPIYSVYSQQNFSTAP